MLPIRGLSMGRYKENYTLFKRGKYWYYRTYDANGIRTTAKTTGKTSKNAARDYCESLYLAGTLISNSLTFGEYAEHFLDDNSPYVKDRVTPLSFNTLKAYRNVLNNHLIPDLKTKKIVDINYTFLKKYRMNLIENYKPSSVQGMLSVFYIIMQTARRDGLITSNPFDILEPMQAPKNTRDAFSRSEVKQLYNEINVDFKKVILMCALTGMRITECISVRESDIVQGNGFKFIHLTKQLQRHGWTDLKTKEKRDIPIIDELIPYIWNNDFFPGTEFYASLKNVASRFPEYKERMLSTHSLRHFFITNSKSCGINAGKVEKIAGHSLHGMQEVYTNFKAEDLTDILKWQKDLFLELNS